MVSIASILFHYPARLLSFVAGRPLAWVQILSFFLSAFLANLVLELVYDGLCCGAGFWCRFPDRLASSASMGISYSASSIALQLLTANALMPLFAGPIQNPLYFIPLSFVTMIINLVFAVFAKKDVNWRHWPESYKWIRNGLGSAGYCLFYNLFNVYVPLRERHKADEFLQFVYRHAANQVARLGNMLLQYVLVYAHKGKGLTTYMLKNSWEERLWLLFYWWEMLEELFYWFLKLIQAELFGKREKTE
jgi:hypothetical protein